MPLHAPSLFDHQIPATHATIQAKDAIIYALSIGYGTRPLHPDHLRHTYGPEIVCSPSLANVIAHPGPWMRQAGVDWNGVVHAEQRLAIHRPLPLDEPLVCNSRMVSIVDKGAGKGMFASFERTIETVDGRRPLATIIQTDACRLDGGCGSHGTPPTSLPKVPVRAPDYSLSVPIREDAALLYRLNGDLNPLHVDPVVARNAGFPRPILHGLCTFGQAGRVISEWSLESGNGGVRALEARFSAPVFPGDLLFVELWKEDQELRFRVSAGERRSIVVDCGRALLASAAL